MSCTNTTSRMAECEARGISRDTCYLAEQNRQAAITGAAEKQALENARNLYPQKAQSAKEGKTFTRHFDGMVIKRDLNGIVTVDGRPAARDEVNQEATIYQQGLYTIIEYKSGKVAVMKNGVFEGYAR